MSDRYSISAAGHLRGAEALLVAKSVPLASFGLLSAQTLECLLKAYISKARVAKGFGGTVGGHDLEVLWTEARGCGLSIAAAPPQWCVTLNSGHRTPYRYRYLTDTDGVTVPPPASTILHLQALRAKVLAALAKP